MLPTLQRVAGAGNVIEAPRRTGSEDFSFYQHVVPGFFFFVGITPPKCRRALVATNHSPRFQIDEDGLLHGVRYLTARRVRLHEQSSGAKKTD